MKTYLRFMMIWVVTMAIATACEDPVYEEVVPDDATQVIEIDKQNQNARITGVDQWGYNWNAHHFNGNVFNAIIGDFLYEGMPFWHMDPYTGDDAAYLTKYPTADQLPFWAYRNMELVMHWNDALINTDGVYQSWIDSDAWITFHYKLGNGQDMWFQFQKMVAARSTDYLENGTWYDENGVLKGLYHDWDDLILISIRNAGFPPEFISPMGPGLGKYKMM